MALAATAALLIPASSALAQSAEGGWHDGRWHGGEERAQPRPPYDTYREDMRDAPRERDEVRGPRFDRSAQDVWLADCRQRLGSRDNGLGGAVIGGVVGGVAGNRIAGHGNRTVGTLAGAAVGAVAGSAIDKAEDRGRNRDECDAYLDDYYASYEEAERGGPVYGAYPAPAYGYNTSYAPAYGYPGGGCCGGAPVMMVPAPVQPEPECTETIEYITEYVPVKRRAYRPAAVKRTKIIADKRVKIGPDKRISAD